MSEPFTVYKSAANCIVELEINPLTSVTNLDRDNVVDKDHTNSDVIKRTF